MQNVVNYICPFFRNGSPIVNGRVYFVKPETTAQTFSDVVNLDGADFIAIKDKNGTLLENPLSLNAEGRFSIQPFVDDGIDFKMIVCYPTGVPAELHDDSMTYDVAYTINSFAQEGEILNVGGVATVDSVADLRTFEPTVRTVLVRGYGAAGDFCPPRIFNWVDSLMTDNYGTRIRSSVSGYTTRGTWVCPPSGFVDVRWFGIDPESGIDYTSVILAIAQEFTSMPVYFPYGSYYLSSHVSFKSVILDRLAIFYPVYEASTDLCFSVENVFENRGGRFDSNGTHCVYPKVKGVLRTSWLSSPMNSALAFSVLSNVDDIIFDDTKTVSVAVTVSNKRILVKKGVTVSSSIIFDPTCCVYYENEGKLSAKTVKLGNGWMLEPDDTQTFPELKISRLSTLLMKIKVSLIEFLTKVKFAVGFILDSDNAWESLDDAQSDWNGQTVLKVKKLLGIDLRSASITTANAVIKEGLVTHGCGYDDSFVSIVAAGGIAYYHNGAYAYGTYSNAQIIIKSIYENQIWSPQEGQIIHIVAQEVSTLQFCFPDGGLNVVFVIDFPWLDTAYTKSFVVVDDAQTVIDTVNVLGVFDINSTKFNMNRVVVRSPTSAERSKYFIDNSVKWMIDPFAV